MDLRCRKPDSFRIDHGLDHVIDQPLDLRAIGLGYDLGRSDQDRVTELGDLA